MARTKGGSLASTLLCRAIKRGRVKPITPDTQCVDCGKPAKHYDHRDYNKPYEVEPVCVSCNIRRGRAVPWVGPREFKTNVRTKRPELPRHVYFHKDGGKFYGEFRLHKKKYRTPRLSTAAEADERISALRRAVGAK